MKVYREVANVSISADQPKNFAIEVAKAIENFQNKNMQIEVLYSTCIENNTLVYSALILGYTEEPNA